MGADAVERAGVAVFGVDVEQVPPGAGGGREFGVGLAEPEALHGLAGASVGAGAVGDPRFRRDPPVDERRILADDVEQLAAPLEEAAGAVAGVAGQAEVEGLVLPCLSG